MSSVIIKGDTSGQIALSAPAVAGTNTLTLPTITGTISTLNSGTVVASTSGTSIDFTSIPAGVRRITVMLGGVGTSGSSNLQIQLGTGATPTYTTTGYIGTAAISTVALALTTGYALSYNISGAITGVFTINLLNSSTNLWVGSGNNSRTVDSGMTQSAGRVTLSDVITALRITTVNGTDTFNAGSINILYE
jgi:hypothetical protein